MRTKAGHRDDQVDGYFKNAAIKILLPKKLRKDPAARVTDLLKTVFGDK
ncbi:MAG: DUF4197 domain-containing protein [Deltaproteobacteria bacterium]|nr:DUF4197 domain-containing protein [Deltaproteobacteria bacterium]